MIDLHNRHYLLIFVVLMCFLPERLSAFTYTRKKVGFFATAHTLTINPTENPIRAVRAKGETITRETVLTLAKRYGAIAAINGGFWKPNGCPAGILKINDIWYATPHKPRGAIGWAKDGQEVLIDQLLTDCHLKNCIDKNNIEIIPMSLPPQTSSEEWKQMDYIVGGAPVLIQNNILIDDYHSEQTIEKFLTRKCSRTAVGIKNNGDWVIVVVDSSLYGFFGGVNIKHLAEIMLEIGCKKAINLDGGSSSTLVIDGKVQNNTYGYLYENYKLVPEVSDAILIFPSINENM